MYCAAAEDDGNNLINGRGDAYCGMLNCSYNLGLRGIHAYIPEYPVGTAGELAEMIKDFIPIATALVGLSKLKVITFGPRPSDFNACNAPIQPLYDLGSNVRKIPNSTCWWLSMHTKMIPVFRLLWQIWPPNWVKATKWPEFSPGWHNMN